jgi:hypothetical protein
MDLADELGEQGLRWAFIVNGHGAPRRNRALDEVEDYFRDTYADVILAMPAARRGSDRILEQERTRAKRQQDWIDKYARRCLSADARARSCT